MYDSNITIIGAGVIGLAIAQKVSQKNEGVFVIEKHKIFGQETSSRNSEVIHAGIYYPKNSLKANLCVKGKKMLYQFCAEFEIPYSRCGKLIVATDEQERMMLDDIARKAKANGVDDLNRMNRAQIQETEPGIFALEALFSPSTGVLDTHSYMKQLESNAVNQGTEFVYGAAVQHIQTINGGYEIHLLDADGSPFSFTSKKVVNAAGLEADTLSCLAGIDGDHLTQRFCKGEYFRIKPPKNKMLKRLIYPVPNPNLEGIGIHVTIDLGGGVKLGPDVTWMKNREYDYSVSPEKQKLFHQSASRFLPFLEYDDLTPEMAGIRPKIQREGGPVVDFYIQEESANGNPGWVNLIGIESPGLTSSLAIADYVNELL